MGISIKTHIYICVCIYIYVPETPPGGYLFRLQDVEKQRERRKTKAKKAERRKKKKLGNMKKPHKFVFFWPCLLKIGKMKFLDKRYPLGGVSPPHIYIYIYICCRVLKRTPNFDPNCTKHAKT